MNAKPTLISSLILFAMLLTACGGNSATPTGNVAILPRDCKMLVNERMPLTLDGSVPPNAAINWDVTAGGVVFSSPGLNAMFTAPADPAVVVVSVTISSGTPSVQVPVTRECIITSPDAGNTSVPQATVGSSTVNTIVISEVMAFPCGLVETRKWNEYVELYNYGDQPVDVSGWWLADLGESGTPEELVSWLARNPSTPFGTGLILNSTVIPAKGYAIILSPSYTEGEFPYAMPYSIPENTVILTAANSHSLGDDFFSINGDGESRDILVLYTGGSSVIQQVISTYGSPRLDSYVTGLSDDGLDNLPLDLHECSSAERIDPLGADIFSNWREINGGSPGEAPY